jgi:hypothetical protein
MTPRQQQIWEKAGRMAYRETEDINEGEFDDLFYRVALDYYTNMLIEEMVMDQRRQVDELKERRSLSKLKTFGINDKS